MDSGNVKSIRKQLEMTQEELAKEAGVSQSLVAKIESGRIDPSHSKMEDIREVLTEKKVQEEPRAEDLMEDSVKYCHPQEKVETAIDIMQENAISQLPVIKDGDVVGLVTESSLLKNVLEEEYEGLTVEKAMDPAPPTVSKETPESAVMTLLKHFPLVLVAEQGEFVGVVTKADVVSKAYS